MRGIRFALALVIAACGPPDREDGGSGGPNGGGGPDEFAPGEACTKIDFVFVVDNSGSMAEEQANLAANFPQFISVIDQYQTTAGTPLDYRVALTTTGRDVTFSLAIPGSPFPPISTTEYGENGEFLQRCGMGRRWLERGDSDVAGTFACNAQVGTMGPGMEMPLYALELALADRIADGTNDGFLREDALLALVILTDEDDCSRRDDGFSVADADVCAGSRPRR